MKIFEYLKNELNDLKVGFNQEYKVPFLKLAKRKEFWQIQRYSLYRCISFFLTYILLGLFCITLFKAFSVNDQKIIINLLEQYISISFGFILVLAMISVSIKNKPIANLLIFILKSYLLINLTFMFKKIEEPLITQLFIGIGIAFVVVMISKKLISKSIFKELQNMGLKKNNGYCLDIDYGKYEGIFYLKQFQLNGNFSLVSSMLNEQNEWIEQKGFTNNYSIVIKPRFNLMPISINYFNQKYKCYSAPALGKAYNRKGEQNAS